MRAMILSAGLGSRLRPLTNSTPKPLVKLGGRPMIQYILDILEQYGYQEILLNAHYLPEQMEEFIQKENKKNKKRHLFLQDERQLILGSGGAIAKAKSWLFEHHETALLCNADALLQPQLHQLFTLHEQLKKEYHVGCTLAVMPHPEAGKKYTGLRCRDHLVEAFVPEDLNNTQKLNLFPGIYMLEHWAANLLPNPDHAYSIVDKLWQNLLLEKKLGAWEYHGPYQDLGTPEELALAEASIAKTI